MLAEINLLPKKDIKNQAKKIIVMIILVSFIFAVVLFLVQMRSLSNQEESMKLEQTALEKQLQIIQEKGTLASNANSLALLQSAIDFVEVTSIDVVPILDEVTKLLPERGYVLEYDQVDVKTVNIKIQFDTNREAAYYLTRMIDSSYFEQVMLQKLNAMTGNVNGEDGVPRVEATYQVKVRGSSTNIEGEDENGNKAS